MSLIASLGAIEIGLIFGLVALGVLMSFRIINFPDLTVDGSFPLGAAVAALGLNYSDIGRQTGKIVVRILKGEKPGTIASQTSTNFELVVNPGAAKLQGVTLSDELLKTAKVVSTK